MKALIIVTIVILLSLPGCSVADVAGLDKVFLPPFEAPDGTVTVLDSDNVTADTLVLNSLPTADPGIPGMVWSDNGTLRISK